MKNSQVKIGEHYWAKVSGNMRVVRIDNVNPNGGWDAFVASTGRKVRIKGAARLQHPPVVTCPCCEGKKQVSLTVTTHGKVGEEKTTQVDCLCCKGEGEVSPEEAKKWEQIDKAWCQCGNPSEKATFSDKFSQNCWTCKDCGKVLQVG